jgi:hypothetical protein
MGEVLRPKAGAHRAELAGADHKRIEDDGGSGRAAETPALYWASN